MKFIIEIEATPQEVRQTMGLPDVKAAQDRVIERMEEVVKTHIEKGNPAELLRTMMPDGLGIFENWGRAMWDRFSKAPEGGGEED